MNIHYSNQTSVLNLLSDMICNVVSENNFYKTKISICNTKKWLIIQGYTQNKSFSELESKLPEMIESLYDLFNLNYTLDSLSEKSKTPVINIIVSEKDRHYYEPNWFTFFNTERPIYSESQLGTYNKHIQHKTKPSMGFSVNEFGGIVKHSSQLINTNEFPFGLTTDIKSKFYLGELIAKDVLRFTKSSHMLFLGFKWDNLHVKSMYSDDDITSCVLDVYENFNIESFNKIIESYDFLDEIKNPTEEKPWLDNSLSRLSEFVIF